MEASNYKAVANFSNVTIKVNLQLTGNYYKIYCKMLRPDLAIIAYIFSMHFNLKFNMAYFTLPLPLDLHSFQSLCLHIF